MHIRWSEDPEKGNTRLWFDGALVLDKKLKTRGRTLGTCCHRQALLEDHGPCRGRSSERLTYQMKDGGLLRIVLELEEVTEIKPLETAR